MRRLLLALVYLTAFSIVAFLLSDGWSYYSTPLQLRPHHPDFWELKPGGSRGLLYGITGASMMTVMLVYSLRKRIRIFRRAGMLARWLDFHIFCGVFGPLLIVLHSSFKVQGLVALSFWSMVAVALSGVFGRYIYGQMPRRPSGEDLDEAEAERRIAELTSQLTAKGIDTSLITAVDEHYTSSGIERMGLIRLLAFTPLDDLLLGSRIRRVTAELPGGREISRGLQSAIRTRAVLRRRVALWAKTRRYFHYWHVFHKPFAVVMYLFMVIHIAVAVFSGYMWVE